MSTSDGQAGVPEWLPKIIQKVPLGLLRHLSRVVDAKFTGSFEIHFDKGIPKRAKKIQFVHLDDENG